VADVQTFLSDSNQEMLIRRTSSKYVTALAREIALRTQCIAC